MSVWTLGVIGGSGLYQMGSSETGDWIEVASPWGEASDDLFVTEWDGCRVVFLPRHGRGHRLSPSEINFRANIDALKRAGCTDILAVSACGSLREDYRPGDFVLVDQFIDRTRSRPSTFFGDGVVAHVSMAEPVSRRLGEVVVDAASEVGARLHTTGTYLAMEGPQFSTRAESKLYRSWGADVIGMTNMPEARLAREAELPYAAVAMVTDYDAWREQERGVEVSDVTQLLSRNAEQARSLLRRTASRLGACARTPDPQGIDTCLDGAILTSEPRLTPDVRDRLEAVAGRRFAALYATSPLGSSPRPP
ncbi:MAG: S-methyl-5'-thioadenosine phosphorylase [Alphaproteobacteria bacterium]|nr:S-methyl-5'-thioadenosine phosphorylase [Alphaproteobacteria bacterium]